MKHILNPKQLQLTQIHIHNTNNNKTNVNVFNKTTPNLGGKFRLELNKLEKLASHNHNCNRNSSNNNKHTNDEYENKFYESNFKSCESSMNVYTQHVPYIKNKEMLLFEKYIYDDKYEPDRTHKHSMHKIKPIKHKASTLYKTTIFRNNHFINVHPTNTTTTTNMHFMNKTETNYYQHNKPFKNHFYEELAQKKQLQRIRHQLWNPSDTLYKELSLKRNEVYHNYFSPDNKNVYSRNGNTNNNNNNNNAVVKKYESSWLINRKFKDEVPMIYPLTLRNNNTFYSKSQETRHDKISHELYKIQYLLNLEEDVNKQNEIVIEYMKERNIDVQYINETTINNFIEYIKGDFVIESDKTLKDNIMKAMFKLNKANTFVTEKHIKTNQTRNVNVSVNNVSSGNASIKQKVPLSSRLEMQTNLSSNKPPKTDGVIVNELFNELEKIKEESREKIQKNLTFSNGDVNRRCLTEDIEQRNVKGKINNKKNKSDLNSIIQRLYYNNIEKNPSFYLNVFKKKGKLLEYIMLERTKNKIKYDKFRSKFNNVV